MNNPKLDTTKLFGFNQFHQLDADTNTQETSEETLGRLHSKRGNQEMPPITQNNSQDLGRLLSKRGIIEF